MILTALVFSVAGCAVFLAAHGVGALYAARSLQGIATGLASGPAGAALIDLQPVGSQRAPLVTSAFSTLGLALGALITSALVQYAPAPTQLIWWALLAVFAAGTVAVLAMAEPGTRRPATRPVHQSAMPAGDGPTEQPRPPSPPVSLAVGQDHPAQRAALTEPRSKQQNLGRSADFGFHLRTARQPVVGAGRPATTSDAARASRRVESRIGNGE